MRDDDMVLIISHVPDRQVAKRIAHRLIEENLAACVNLGSPTVSMYQWQGVTEETEEIPLHIKTTYGRYAALADLLRQMHPYEVPEIIVLPVIDGAAPYLDWVREQSTLDRKQRD